MSQRRSAPIRTVSSLFSDEASSRFITQLAVLKRSVMAFDNRRWRARKSHREHKGHPHTRSPSPFLPYVSCSDGALRSGQREMRRERLQKETEISSARFREDEWKRGGLERGRTGKKHKVKNNPGLQKYRREAYTLKKNTWASRPLGLVFRLLG